MNTESSTSQFPVSQLNFSRQIKVRCPCPFSSFMLPLVSQSYQIIEVEKKSSVNYFFLVWEMLYVFNFLLPSPKRWNVVHYTSIHFYYWNEPMSLILKCWEIDYLTGKWNRDYHFEIRRSFYGECTAVELWSMFFMVTSLNFLTTYQVIATQIGTMGTIMYARSASGFCAISLISFIFLDNWNFEQQILREQIVLLKRIPDLMHSFMIYYYCLC